MDNDYRNLGEIAIFRSENNDVNVQIDTVNETIWLRQKGMSELFDVGVPAINKHIKNIFEAGELKKDMVISKMGISTDIKEVNNKRNRQKGALFTTSICFELYRTRIKYIIFGK